MKIATFLLVSAITFKSMALIIDQKEGKVTLEKLEDYDRCQSMDYRGDFCNAALEDWISKHPEDTFQAAKLTRRHMNAWGAIPFFSKAFSAGKQDCNDADLWLAVESAAGLPANDRYKTVMDQMKKIAFNICFKELKTKLVKAHNEGGYAEDNLCPELKKMNAIKKVCSK